jgi:hypothetical protein
VIQEHRAKGLASHGTIDALSALSLLKGILFLRFDLFAKARPDS